MIERLEIKLEHALNGEDDKIEEMHQPGVPRPEEIPKTTPFPRPVPNPDSPRPHEPEPVPDKEPEKTPSVEPAKPDREPA